MNALHDKLFLALAAGRLFCGLAIMANILMLTWCVKHIGQDGMSFNSILATAGMFILTLAFTKNIVIRWSADHPYPILIVSSVVYFITAVMILLVGEILPYSVLIGCCISSLIDRAYVLARKALFNRVYYGDKNTKLGTTLDLVNAVAGCAGGGIAMLLPCNLAMIAGIIFVVNVFVTLSNYFQIKYLLMLQPKNKNKSS